MPTLRERAGEWDAVVAHYLGVDHVGHTHAVDTPQMADKLAEMDAHVAEVRACVN